MKSIQEAQHEIVEEFALFEERLDKYEHLIEMGKSLPKLNEDLRVDSAIVKGCQSKVWLHAQQENGIVNFKADSDAFIVRGLIALLLKIYSGRDAEEIIKTEPTFINEIGLQDMLSMTRSNGLSSMIKQIKYYALAYQSVKS